MPRVDEPPAAATAAGQESPVASKRSPGGESGEAVDDADLAASSLWGPGALDARRRQAAEHQARYAGRRQRWIESNAYYYRQVKRLLEFVIEPHRSVLSVRCEDGYLLAASRPVEGVGVDISSEMVELARTRHPRFRFSVAHPEDLELDRTFDYILFDHITDTADILPALRRLRACSESQTRLVIYSYNRLWEPIVRLAEKVRIKMPMPEQNWLADGDIKLLLELAGFEHLNTYRIVLLPKYVPLLSNILNRFVARLPLINKLCMSTVRVARPAPRAVDPANLKVSVVIPCKNEEGNIRPAVERMPELGAHTEIIFCDDRSTDGTADAVREMQRRYPHRDIRLVDGPGVCKADNVWTGFEAATGDILMILDADLTVMPEELPHFVEALACGRGEFINGSRLVYPMQQRAMKTANLLGNKFFSVMFSYLLDQRVKDTLCGTKVIWRRDWPRIRRLIGSWGTEDRWGDYDLLFGAAKLQLKIVDLPVHYQERIHGSTKMVRVFHNGLIMLRKCGAAFAHLKLGY